MRTPVILAAAAAIGISGATLGNEPASAQALVTPAIQTGETANIENVQYRGQRYYHPRRHASRYHYPRHHRFHHRHRDRGASVAGIAGLAAGAILGQALTAPRAHTQTFAYAGVPQAHVQWCQQRYRSYDITTDSFLSYDGNRYRCNSPYVAR
jgi:hypothetical protein